MKTSKAAAITLLLSCLLSIITLAQSDTIKIAEKEQLSAARPYYEQPGFPDSFANAQRKKSGRNEKYLNVNKLHATLLLGLINKASPDEVPAADNSEHKTFDISLYRVKQSLSVCLNIEKQLGASVTVRLLNARGEELHAELVSQLTRNYARRFDLAKMQDGSYTLEVRNGREVIRRALMLSSAEPVEKPSRTIAAIN